MTTTPHGQTGVLPAEPQTGMPSETDSWNGSDLPEVSLRERGAGHADDQDDAKPPAGRAFGARMVRGPPEDPAWARPALLVLLACAAVLYLWNLSASGYANKFYAAAAQAG